MQWNVLKQDQLGQSDRSMLCLMASSASQALKRKPDLFLSESLDVKAVFHCGKCTPDLHRYILLPCWFVQISALLTEVQSGNLLLQHSGAPFVFLFSV